MKHTLYLIALAGILFSPACKKVKENLQTDADKEYTPLITVPAAQEDTSVPFPAGGMWLSLPVVPVATMHDDFLNQYNVTGRKITYAGINVLTYQFVSTSDSFSFLDSAQVFVSAKDLSEQFVGYVNKAPGAVSAIQLTPVSTINLKDYFLKDTMYFRLLWHIHAAPPVGKQFAMKANFRILADPL